MLFPKCQTWSCHGAQVSCGQSLPRALPKSDHAQSFNNSHTWLQAWGDESCWQETESIRFWTKQEKQERRNELMRSRALKPPSMLDTAQFCLGKQLLLC